MELLEIKDSRAAENEDCIFCGTLASSAVSVGLYHVRNSGGDFIPVCEAHSDEDMILDAYYSLVAFMRANGGQ